LNSITKTTGQKDYGKAHQSTQADAHQSTQADAHQSTQADAHRDRDALPYKTQTQNKSRNSIDLKPCTNHIFDPFYV